MANKVPSRSERRASAGLPTKASTAELAKMGRLTYLSAEPSQARNPQTGEMGPIMMVTVEDSDGRRFQAAMGGVALQRELQEYIDADAFPFTATLSRKGEGPGNPWTFND